MTTINMEQAERDLPTIGDSNGKDFVQLVNNMINHEKAKDMELIRTLQEGIVFLRTDIINKQATIDSLLKQLDRLSLAVNCNCQCPGNNVNNDFTAITDLSHFSDGSRNEEEDRKSSSTDHGKSDDVTLQRQSSIPNEIEFHEEDINDIQLVESRSSQREADDKQDSSDGEEHVSATPTDTSTYAEGNVIRSRPPKPDEVFV